MNRDKEQIYYYKPNTTLYYINFNMSLYSELENESVEINFCNKSSSFNTEI